MKANNKSWKEIAIEVGASKKDVIARFKVLSDADEKNEASTSMRVNTVCFSRSSRCYRALTTFLYVG